jgi:hypothetical protein
VHPRITKRKQDEGGRWRTEIVRAQADGCTELAAMQKSWKSAQESDFVRRIFDGRIDCVLDDGINRVRRPVQRYATCGRREESAFVRQIVS